MKKIVLTGGGTAGHCIAHVALMPYLKEQFGEIYYIGSENGIERRIMEKYVPYFGITTVKLIRKPTLKNLAIPFKLKKGIEEAKKLLLKIQPNVVFSKGGFVSLPVVIAADKLKIPVISHECDLSVGLANRLSQKRSIFTATSFPETAKQLKNGVYTGSPIRSDLLAVSKEQAIKNLRFKPNKPLLLVTGGSSGAQKINQVIRDNLLALTKKYDILHLTGKGNLDKKIIVNGYVQIEFTEDMASVFALSDFVISRAGSNTIFELISLKKPSGLIPLPKGVSRGDQVLNAKYFEEKGFFEVLEQKNLNIITLTEKLNSLEKNKDVYIKKMEQSVFKNGSVPVMKLLEKY